MNIILIGFMGCGKSTIGVRLSYRMKHPYLDTDKYIEKAAGCTISEIFEKSGEEAFRTKETETLKYFMDERIKDYIISTGGGMPTREENIPYLKKLGVVVWLRITPETVYERLKSDTTRPLLQSEDPKARICELMESRKEAYGKCADVIVDVDGKTIERIMDEIFTKSNGVWKKKKKEIYRL